MSKLELAIDVGSANLTIYQRGKGVVIREPNIAIVNNNAKIEVIEMGEKAMSMLGRAERKLKPIYPVSEGAVIYPEVFTTMIKRCIAKLSPSKIFKPSVTAIVLVSQCLNEIERKNIETVMFDAGIKEVTLVDAPLANYAYNELKDGLYLDIGADLTDVSIVTGTGIMSGYTINIGGNTFNNLICDRITNKYGVKVGKYTTEKVKKTIGSMYDNDVNVDEVMGFNIIDGEKMLIDVSANDVAKSVKEPVNNIIDIINTLLNMCPKELANDIVRQGIFVSGGSVLLPGFEEYILEKTKINVIPAKDLTTANCLGGGRLLENQDLLNKLLRTKNI